MTQDIILVPEDDCDVMRIRLEPAVVGAHFDEEDVGWVGATRQNSGFFEDTLKKKSDKNSEKGVWVQFFSSSGNKYCMNSFYSLTGCF
jgi:hypothetical protein